LNRTFYNEVTVPKDLAQIEQDKRKKESRRQQMIELSSYHIQQKQKKLENVKQFMISGIDTAGNAML
jgi:hypothetical protein